MGMGTATVQAQAGADRLGLAVENVTFEYGDTLLPPGTIAGGSSQTASIAAAVSAACAKLVADLLKRAAMRRRWRAFGGRGGGARRRARARRCGTGFETYTSILSRAGLEEISAEADAPAPMEFSQYSMHSYGAQFCEVRVNEVTVRYGFRDFWDRSMRGGY